MNWPHVMPAYERGDTLAVFRTADDAYKVINLGQDPRIAPAMVFPYVPWPPRTGSIPLEPDAALGIKTRCYLLEGIEYRRDREIDVAFYRERTE